MQLDEIIVEIRVKHRRRCHAMESRKILDLRMGALLRLELGWRKDLPEKERKAIAARAAELMEGEEAHLQSRLPYEKMEADAKKEMAKLAKRLPVWEAFGAGVRGFGEVSLAVIVAEAGDLSNYANPGKLWKRLGLAPGQNRVPPNLSREQRAQAWIERGYSPRRRSHIWNIGDALIKGNQDGPYRTLYLERKAYEHARDPEMTKMHAHRRAQRYMEKRLLRDLWQAWREAKDLVIPSRTLPPAPIQETGRRLSTMEDLSREQRAKHLVKSNVLLPSAPT
jgi:hypothetical protein